jgi:hypothetical protein
MGLGKNRPETPPVSLQHPMKLWLKTWLPVASGHFETYRHSFFVDLTSANRPIYATYK